MIRVAVANKIEAVVASLVAAGRLPAIAYPSVEVIDTKQPEHGDLATTWAMPAFKLVSAGGEGARRAEHPTSPRALAELLAKELENDAAFERTEVAGPGFINLSLSQAFFHEHLGLVRVGSGGSVLEDAGHFARPRPPAPSVSAQTSETPPPKAANLGEDPARALSINVEFVSVNPNGPITIGSGRGAAYGSTLCNVLEAAGHNVHREYYINDGVNSEQMRLFAESVRALLMGEPIPEGGYKGDYVGEVAHAIVPFAAQNIFPRLTNWSEVPIRKLQFYCQNLMVWAQRRDLEAFGVTFDTWFSEQSLHDSGKVQRHIDALVEAKIADEKPVRTKLKLGKGGVVEEVVKEAQERGGMEGRDGDEHGGHAVAESRVEAGPHDDTRPSTTAPDSPHATLWLRSTLFGDDMDRVLRRQDGRLTYIASDVAYHADKFTRGGEGVTPADKLITILGPDHHGYIHRLHAVVAAELMAEDEAGRVMDEGGREAPAGQRATPHEATALSDVEAQLYGTAARRDACQAALAQSRQKLEVLIFQLVRFIKDGKPAPMRKRDGNIYALIDLIHEIGEKVKPSGTLEERLQAGRDVARFFYLMRHHDTTFDFDLDLAARQSDENPVFYVQYAHARVCSVIDKAAEAGLFAPQAPSSPHPAPSSSSPTAAHEDGAPEIHPKERALILKICDLPHEVQRCADDYAVSRLTTYAVELARTYHHFYDVCRVIDPDQREVSEYRLSLCVATRAALKAVLDLLGISAPARMERET